VGLLCPLLQSDFDVTIQNDGLFRCVNIPVTDTVSSSGNMSEPRKVQRTAGGTYFVCLPKSWADRYGVHKGAVIGLSETSDGKLIIDTEFGVEQSPTTVSLEPGPHLSREIIAKYLLGFDVIRVEGKKRIGFDIRDVVKNTVRHLVGLEIVEEDYSGIVLQCLLEPSGFPPEKILRRGYSIAAGMNRDVINAFVEGDVQLAKSVMARDDEGNRLYFLLVRILRTIIQNPSLSEKLGVGPIECLDYRLAASLVEAIGDDCVRTAQKTIELGGKGLGKEMGKLFMNLQLLCLDTHEKALNAFLVGDVELAEEVRSMRARIENEFDGVEKLAQSHSVGFVPHILAVASFLRQIYEHSVDISDLAVSKRN
jgi:phosphate uptake regulator